ncbi:MAG TPA: DNA methyltransferase [Hyphomicrobiaceae bacterium]|nr:DNA methyltransferase [Hyphomicrobiaceae bacterium]
MAVVDPNLEWLGYVQPVGLVLSTGVLDRYGLVPEEQTRADGDAVAACLAAAESPRALADPWTFFARILGWREHQLAGLPNAQGGGRPLPEGLSVLVDEADTELTPHWAVIDPEGRPTLLVRIEDEGVEPDRRGALAGWEASPHQRFERLLRENAAGVRAGLLITDDQLRLVYAPKGETSGWLSFPLRALATVAGRPMLGGLKLALNAFRLNNDTEERRLPGLLKQSRDAQAEVSERLSGQVLGALHQLLRGLHAADEARIARLAKDQPEKLYGGLLTVLLRLVFLLYAEDRGLVPSATDEESRRLYDQGYGVRALHAKLTADAARYPDTMEERRGAWARLLVLFRLIHKGGGEGFIKGRGGDLFDPALHPFLLGQDKAGDPIAPATVSDGCILGVLDKLLILDGERLSYRTLDVEQIGSVYETVMGFTVETMPGPALALKGGKNDKVPVFVDLAGLAALKGAERKKRLKDAYEVKLPDRVAQAVTTARSLAELEAALRPRVDERASPGATLSIPGSPLLQPTDERRRSGSHYTPRTLTEPIVRHALEPAFERLGPGAKPEAVLSLKVCDPAMGSGAFLVEACRQLAARLVQAWTRWPETRPRIPDDEDEELHAKRLVAQRCLYGVDKNPLATDLAKLSLWLATLARDHEFTFLDHALKSGDSLVGLTLEQIKAAHWDTSKPGLPLFNSLVKDRIAKAMEGRAEIQQAPDDTMRAILEKKHQFVEEQTKFARIIGDAVIAAFFAEDKPKAREKKRADVESWLMPAGKMEADWDRLCEMAGTLRKGPHPLRPFHWEVEFPEVFAHDNGGFDVIVGNPPFLGGSLLSMSMGKRTIEWLTQAFQPSSGKSDLVAFFFRRAFALIKKGGTFGLIGTKTIRQGLSRFTSLEQILLNSGNIYRAIRRYRWPGEAAAVVVAVVHVSKGERWQPILDGREVKTITSFLLPMGPNSRPANLLGNADKVYSGVNPNGAGFVFEPPERQSLIATCPEAGAYLRPYLSSEDLNGEPTCEPARFIADVGSLSEEMLKDCSELYEHLKSTVWPERQRSSERRLREQWWKFSRPAQDRRPCAGREMRDWLWVRRGGVAGLSDQSHKWAIRKLAGPQSASRPHRGQLHPGCRPLHARRQHKDGAS